MFGWERGNITYKQKSELRIMDFIQATKLALFIYGLAAVISFAVACFIKILVVVLEATYARKK